MISTEQAQKIILDNTLSLRSNKSDLKDCLGKVLKEDIFAGRDFPAFNRVMMDGIAIRYKDYQNGFRSFFIVAKQGAGSKPIGADKSGQCIQIMTGSALDKTFDTIVPIEDVSIKDGKALIHNETIKKGQFIHKKGQDAKKGIKIIKSNQILTPDMLAAIATVGKTQLLVASLPKVAIVSTGDELVKSNPELNEFKIISSNYLAIGGFLNAYGINPKIFHIKDDSDQTYTTINKIINKYDVLIISGGVSKGEYDYVKTVLEELPIKKLFHGVKQRPGKVLWFGCTNKTTIFALPGNPVSVQLCMSKFVIPWLKKSLGLEEEVKYGILGKELNGSSDFTKFNIVKIKLNEQLQPVATPVPNNNSGDLFSLTKGDGFIELPPKVSTAKAGDSFKIWLYRNEII